MINYQRVRLSLAIRPEFSPGSLSLFVDLSFFFVLQLSQQRTKEKNGVGSIPLGGRRCALVTTKAPLLQKRNVHTHTCMLYYLIPIVVVV
jgi:hypothetical protein